MELTARARDVLALPAEPSRDIAAMLNISFNRATSHMKSMYLKFSVPVRERAVARGLALGLGDRDTPPASAERTA